MDVKEIKRLLDAVAAAEISELVLETGDVKLTVRRGGEAAAAVPPVAQALPAPAQGSSTPAGAPAPAPSGDAGSGSAAAPATGGGGGEVAPAAPSRLIEVTAPIVGTFYEASGPDAPAYVKVGDEVKAGAVLCIIEAMKLMNEIEAETDGTIAEILVRNEEPVEYGQVLFRIDPD